MDSKISIMAGKSGIWVDSKKAIVVKLKNSDRTFKVIDSGMESREKKSGEGKKFGRFAKQFLTFEKRDQRKKNDLEKRYFKSILKEISGAEDLVLFGPSSTKHRLQREINSNNSVNINLKGVENADSMTDNQVKAWVLNYFKEEE